jgi:hypothetical protein
MCGSRQPLDESGRVGKFLCNDLCNAVGRNMLIPLFRI